MKISESLCNRLAKILGGKGMSDGGRVVPLWSREN